MLWPRTPTQCFCMGLVGVPLVALVIVLVAYIFDRAAWLHLRAIPLYS